MAGPGTTVLLILLWIAVVLGAAHLAALARPRDTVRRERAAASFPTTPPHLPAPSDPPAPPEAA